jgi:predicted O-linked N-acetylglucosamine transferase (SPINDLY family)
MDAAYDAAAAAMTSPYATPPTRRMAVKLLLQLGGSEQVERLGDFAKVGREWAAAGRHDMLMQQMPRVRTHADRLELVEQHRIAAGLYEAKAIREPIRPPPPRAPSERLRIGFLSADLRAHVVGSFALPLFENADPSAVDLVCYSAYRGPADRIGQLIRARSTVREIGHLSDQAAAQVIADDGLDILIDLGGSTGDNRLGVMAYRTAPVTISWMGYPHSTGLSSVDYILLDRALVPPSPGLLAEQPLLMPHAWICLARLQFSQAQEPDPVPPRERTGVVTFGTANQALKYSPAALAAWARTLLAVPDSTLLIFRAECASARFRDNLVRAFAAHGVGAERLRFEAVRGTGYLNWYDAVDICLDTFPLTGGTTTCEALWMGVPVVSLVGEGVFERLSHSILTHAGLADLSVPDEAAFVAKAAELAGDVERLRALRRGLRAQIAASPLGDGPGFARDFYRLMATLKPAAPAVP